MRRASVAIEGPQIDPKRIVDRVALDHDHRFRRRLLLRTVAGDEILLDLAEARHLKHGDGLLLDEGGVVLVEALAEPLLEIRAASPAALTRIAWHLGNRHLPTQLGPDWLRIRVDHVIAALVRHLGGSATPLRAPFDPEGGAYGESAAAPHHHGAAHAAGHEHVHEHR